MRRIRCVAALAALSLVLVACETGDTDDPADDTNATGEDGVGAESGDGNLLQDVRDRGELVCGVNDAVPGFGVQNEEGEFEGFDVDYCRVIAAGVLGDADAVEYVPLTAEARFTSLQAGEIDVLVRNTTWTATRDGSEGASFAVTTFYDGQGMMVREDSDFESIDDMNNTAICVLSGTTTELNLETQFAQRDLDYEAQTFEDNDPLQEAFIAERCDGWTSDKSQLAAIKSAWPEDEGGPDALRILDDTMSKEPLGPAVRDGDDEWYDAVNWSVIATIQAEEFGVNQDNVEQMVEDTNEDDDPDLARFLGITSEDVGIGLEPDYAVDVISQVGNYADIYERHVGPDTPLGLERTENALWTDGGLLYPPPYR